MELRFALQGSVVTAMRGTWSNVASYLVGEVVYHEGSSYLALLPTVGVTPGTDATKWQIIAAGGVDGTDGNDPLPTFPSITDLACRLSARESTITHVDGRISQWNDISGNNKHAVQATGTNQPRYLKTRFNDRHPCVYFDGVNGKMTISIAVPQPFTVVSVIQNYSGGVANDNIYNSGGAVGFISGGNSWAINAGASLLSTAHYSADRVMVPIGDTTLSAVRIDTFNGANSQISRNGVDSALGNAGSNNIVATVTLGGDSGTSRAKMYLYEFLIFGKVLSAPERAQLYSFYSQACNITAP